MPTVLNLQGCLLHFMTVPGVPKQSVAGPHLHPTTPAHNQLASQHLSSPQQLSTFIQASFPCCSAATNRTAPVPLTNLPQAKSFLQICVVWSPCTRARGATAFLDSSSAARKRQPLGTVPGGCRVGRWLSTGRGIRVPRGTQGLTPTWVSLFALQLLPNFPLTDQTSSPFAFASARNSSLQLQCCSCPALACPRLALSPNLSHFRHTHPLHAASHKQ